MKLLVLGYSKAGKSIAASILAEVLGTKYLNTSDQLVKELAIELRISEEHILANKDQYRMQLFKLGRARQETDPLWPQTIQLQEADTEIQLLEERLQTEYELPIDFMTG